MTNIAWKNLSQQRLRFALSVGGVAFAVLLMLIVQGLYDGILDQATEYARGVDADLWVSQAASPDRLIQSTSTLPIEVREELTSLAGVAQASPVLTRAATFPLGGRDVDLFLVGVAGRDAAGWPAELRREGRIPRQGELVVDRVFARIHKLNVDDFLQVGGTPMRIVGIVRGGNALVYQYAWMTLEDVGDLFDAHDIASHFLVRTDGTSASQVARRIAQEAPHVRARTPAALARAEATTLGEGFRPMLLVLIFIAVAVGAVTIGLIIYTATVEKAREYGVLKAIGFSNRLLYRVVLQQSAIAAGAGFLAGGALSYAVGALGELVQPVFVAAIGLDHVALALLATALMALVAALVPARSVARLSPAEVFRA